MSYQWHRKNFSRSDMLKRDITFISNNQVSQVSYYAYLIYLVMRMQYIKVVDIKKNIYFPRNSKKRYILFSCGYLFDNQAVMEARDALKFKINY
jgi:hypothetical protein